MAGKAQPQPQIFSKVDFSLKYSLYNAKHIILLKIKMMDRKILIERLKTKIERLPDTKIQEMSDFADLLLSKTDNKITINGIGKLVQDSRAFVFLKDDEDLYTIHDLKIKYK